MSASDLNAQLQQAIALAQEGRTAEARSILEAIVAANPNQEIAWLWLATVSGSVDERITFLERALALNPNNPTSQQAYQRLTGRAYMPPGTPLPPVLPGETPMSVGRKTVSGLIIIMAVAAVAVVVILVAINLRDSDTENQIEESPTAIVFPTNTLTPTLLYSLTPSDTPWPSDTPGPTPTPVTLPPTWTPVPSSTPFPTRTMPPTWTPRPTMTLSPTVLPFTPTFTPLPTRTLNARTQTAEAAQATEEATAEASE